MSLKQRVAVSLTVIGAMAALWHGPAGAQSQENAQPQGGVEVELNKLEPAEDACSAYILLRNGTEAAFESLELYLVVLDADGIVSKRLAVETAPLPAEKTRLKVFNIDGMDCEQVGQVLINEVLSCADGTGRRPDCLDMVTPSSRTHAEFIK